MKINGHDNLPSSGGYILAANHNSLADPPLVAAAVKTKLNFMAKEELFRIPFFGSFIRNANAFPVKRDVTDKKAIKRSLKILRSGERLLIFPEGGRFDSGKALTGISYLAHKTGVPVIPVGLVNNYDFHLLKRIYVNIGLPVNFEKPPHKKSQKKEYDFFASHILKEIYKLSANTV